MNFAVLQFPGSNCDQDVVHVLRNVLGHSARLLWHKDNSLGDADAVIVPGGFSYGDYLRTGAIARFSPVMQAVQQVRRQRRAGAGHLQRVPDSVRSRTAARRADPQPLAAVPLRARLSQDVTAEFPFTNRVPPGKLLRIPVAHGEGCYFADEPTLARLKANNQMLWQYVNAQGEPTETPTRTVRSKTSPASATRRATWPA